MANKIDRLYKIAFLQVILAFFVGVTVGLLFVDGLSIKEMFLLTGFNLVLFFGVIKAGIKINNILKDIEHGK